MRIKKTVAQAKEDGSFERLVRFVNGLAKYNRKETGKTLVVEVFEESIDIYDFNEDKTFYTIQFKKPHASKGRKKRR